MKGALKGAALGAALAGAAALLLAPKSGKKTRDDLKKLLDTASTDLQKKAKKIQNLSQAQYEELFLSTLAQAARKKEEITDMLADVTAVLKKGWNDVSKELKNPPSTKATRGTKGKK